MEIYTPNDEEATLLLDVVETETDPARKTKAMDMLGRYRQAKLDAGLEPFAPNPEEVRKKTARVESLYSGLDQIEAQLSPEQSDALKSTLTGNTDPDEAKARMVNQSWLLTQRPELAGQVDADWASVKRNVAQSLLGMDKPNLTDKEFYSGVSTHLTNKKKREEAAGVVLGKIQDAAFSGEMDWLTAYRKASGGLDNAEGITPAERDHYRQQAEQVFKVSSAKALELRPLAERLLGTLSRETNAQEGFENYRAGVSREEIIPTLAALPDVDRQLVYKMLAQDAAASEKTNAVEGKSATQKVGEKFGRQVRDLALSQIDYWDQAMLEGRLDYLKRIQGGETAYYQNGEIIPRSGLLGVNANTPDSVVESMGTRRATDKEVANFTKKMATAEKEYMVAMELKDIAEGVVDPAKFDNRFLDGLANAPGQIAYSLQAAIPVVGVPLLINSTKAMRTREMVGRGIPFQQASEMAMASAVVEAPIEWVQSKMLFGKIPGMGSVLTKPLTQQGLAALARRGAGLFAAEYGLQNLQEAAQDATPLILQEIASRFDPAIPATTKADWQEFGSSRIDTAFTLLPITLLGTGVASMKEGAYARAYLGRAEVLKAAGFTDKAVEAIIAEPSLDGKQAIVEASWDDPTLRKVGTEEQQAAAATLDAENAALAEEVPTGAVEQNADGTYTVRDVTGNVVDTAATPEEAAALNRATMSAMSPENIAEADSKGFIAGSSAEAWADKILRDAQTKVSANPLLDPQLLAAYAIKGAAIVERGIRKFPEWSKEMVAMFGDKITPHLQEIYDATGEYEKAHKKYSAKEAPRVFAQIVGDAPVDEKTGQRRVTERVINAEGAADKFNPEVRAKIKDTDYEVLGLGKIQESVKSILALGVDKARIQFESGDGSISMPDRVGVGLALAEQYNAEGRYDEAAGIIDKVAALGTELGQSINVFKMLGMMLDTPEKAQAFYARQRQKLTKGVKDRVDTGKISEEVKKTLDKSDGKTPAQLEAELIKRLKARGLKTTDQVRDAIKRLIELNAEGKLSTPKIEDIILSKYNIPQMSAEDQKTLADLARKIARNPQNSVFRSDAVLDLMNFVNDKLKGVSAWDKAWSIWYGNVLSGYNTHIRNVTGNIFELLSTGFLDTLRANPAKWFEAVQNALYGGKEGFQAGIAEGVRHLKKGDSIVGRADAGKFDAGKFDAGNVLERTTFSGGKANPFNYIKYAQRTLAAEDAVAFMTAYEMKSMQVAWEIAESEGLEGDAFGNRVAELLNQTDTQQMEFKERAEAEWANFEKGDVKATKEEYLIRRVRELTTMERNGDLVERATNFGNRVSFNYKPEGVLGVIAEGIGAINRGLADEQIVGRGKAGQLLKGVSMGTRLIVPFTRVVANVVNRQLDFLVGVPRAILFSSNLILEGGRVVLKEKTADDRAIELRKGITGLVGGAAIAAYLAPNDDDDKYFKLHGSGPGSYAAQQQLKALGWQPWSLQIGGEFYSFRQLPIGIMLSTIGEYHDGLRYKERKDAETLERAAFAMSAAGMATLDASFLSGLADFMSALSETNDEARSNALRRFMSRTASASNAVPFSAMLRQLTTDLDDYDRDSSTVNGFLASQVPISQVQGKPAINALGDPVQNKFFESFIGRPKTDAQGEEIFRAIAAKEAWIPSIKSYAKKENFFKQTLSDEKFYEFQKLRGGYLKEMLAANLDTINLAPDEVAKKIVASAADGATTRALAEVGFYEEKKDSN